jgi:hypothetical protein
LLFAAALRPDDFFAAGLAVLFGALLLAFDALLFDAPPLAALAFELLLEETPFDPDFAELFAAISRLPFGPAREEMRPRRRTSLDPRCSPRPLSSRIEIQSCTDKHARDSEFSAEIGTRRALAPSNAGRARPKKRRKNS